MLSFMFRTLVGVALLAYTAAAQTQTATLRGSVRDSSGAVIPNAKLILTNVAQDRPWTTESNAAGEYTFLQIPPGPYSLTVEAAGFKRYSHSQFTLEVAQIAAVDITLDVGSMTETVEVRGDAPLLETASSTLGEVVNSLTAEALPLNGRNVMQLVALTPGINTSPSFDNAAVGSGQIANNAFSANGGRNVANTIIVDGAPQEVMGYNQPSYVPNPDAVQEFRVQTNGLSAEYGRTAGGVVNMVTRSGTKEFHGVLFHFLRNDALDANGFFNNLNGRNKGPFRFNQFGGTLGGPLNRSRDRTFFFFSYEGVRQVNPGSSFFSVPTERMRNGDFSEVPNRIYDPATINAAGERQPFPGNIIPANRISPVARNFMAQYPLPTLPGIQNNFFSQAGSRPSDNAYSIRVDHRFGDRHNLYGRVSWNDRKIQLANHFGSNAAPNTGQDASINRSATIDHNSLVGDWIVHGNIGYAYAANPRSAPTGITLSSLGFPAALDRVMQYDIFPRVEPAGYSPLGGDPTWVIGNKFETYNLNADAARLVGSHSIKFGGTYRLNKVSNFRPNAPAGLFTFNENWTRQFFNRAGGGDAFASMMLGYVQGGRIQQEPRIGLTVPYVALFLQDDWRITQKLTLNIGLRWDSDRPMVEMHDRTSWFDFNAPVPINPPGLPQPVGGLVFANRDGSPRGNKNADNNNFAPRIGFAWQAASRVVLRSGFGVFFNPTTGIGPSTGSSGALSYNANTPIVSSNDGGRTPFATLQNPFPAGINQPENGANGLRTFLGQSVSAINRGDRTPYTMQWNFNIQYQLGPSQLFDVAYAGNAGVKLQAQSNLNQLPDEYLALGDALNAVVPNPFRGIAPATAPLGGATVTAGQLLRPYPHFQDITHVWGSQGHSTYHGLQAKFRQRFAGGLQLLGGYTWSKTIDDFSSVAGFVGLQNPGYTNNNRKDLDKSISALDIAHRLVTNFQYELPFGAGKRFLPGGGWSNALIGGWRVNGVWTLQSGLPISVSSAQNLTFSYGGDSRPDSTGLKSKTPGSAKERYRQWLNPAAFTDPARFTFGNVGRFLPDNRGPGLHSWDISVLKDISFNESRRLQFRGEFFNAFNQVNFSNPSATVFGLTPSGALARPDFGRITGTRPARVIQLGLKFYY
jgi:hypothetical protein